MRAGAYNFNCQIEDGALLPIFKGSTLRGGLGQSLRRIVCALKQRECNDCLLAVSCAYSFLFANGTGTTRRPHPYLLVAPEDGRRYWQPGAEINFSLLLFGRANDFLPHLVYAVKEMGQAGLGKKSQAPGRFTLKSVGLSGAAKPVWQNDTLYPPADLPELRLAPPPPEPVRRLRLHCLTPLRLKYDNHLQAELPFHLLIRAALRRISSLEATYGQGEPTLDYKGLVARAQDVEVAVAECRWQDIKRYSNRQRAEMFIGGITGSVTYRGADMAEFVPLLRYCEMVHLGKQTTFGLGRFVIELDDGGGK